MKSAIVIGHPGHELRALKFIETYKPLVFVITDGSGSKGVSRLERSRNIFDGFGCEISPFFGVFKDAELYDIILKKNIDVIIDLKDKIHSELDKHDINFIFGDACEGFNPTHDLCRYIINSYVKHKNSMIFNYDFMLDSPPVNATNNILGFMITNADKTKREEIISNYPELGYEVELAKKRYGEKIFDMECLREVKDFDQIRTWDTEKPYYQIFGEKRKQEGIYSEIITFEDHILPICKLLI